MPAPKNPQSTPPSDELAAAKARVAELEEAAKAHAAELAKRDEQIAELEEAATDPAGGKSDAGEESSGQYYVMAAGCPYAVGGNPALIQIAMHGHVIELVDSEARRLLLLDAVRAATEVEVMADEARREREAGVDAENTAGPAGNPFGGQVVNTTLERHAAEQIALARKAGRL